MNVEMDSSSDSMEFLPKLEVLENERDCCRLEKLNWNSENTMKLIETLERECQELWNMKHPEYRNKAARQIKYERLASMFETSVEEITRKVHNLRTQFNNELRKIRKKQEKESGSAVESKWEYFEALTFLKLPMFDSTPDPLELDSVNLELAEFQAEEEEEFRKAAARALKEASTPKPSLSTSLGRKKPMLRVAASAPPPLPASAHPLMWPDMPLPRIRPSMNADECQIFGDFVASELRTLQSHESRKRLKRMIQKAILQVEEEEESNVNS